MGYNNLTFVFHLAMTLLFVLFHSSSAVVAIQVSNKLIDALCEETSNPEFCKNTLKSNSDTKQADMNGLGIITIMLATAQARVNKYIVKSFLQNENDGVTKDKLSTCQIDYEVTLGKLKGAYRLSDKKDYRGMGRLVNDAMKMTKKCEDVFNRPPARPSPLTDLSQKMVWLNNIALVTLDVLDGQCDNRMP